MNTQTNVILQTDVPGIPKSQGKVRDIYDLGDRLILVVTDRISAFDVVMPNGIPWKGIVLTQISKFWFKKFGQFDAAVENHLISTDVNDMPEAFARRPEVFAGRSTLVKKLKVAPVECVVRGYITGSGWKEYQASGSVCGIKLPAGLRQCDKLPEPIFTPATKATSGHDENISFDRAAEIIGRTTLEELRRISIALYRQAADYAAGQGIIIADTKFEFGLTDEGRPVLIDEALTPDSSRFWPADEYEPGHDQPSFDKQYVRNFLETLDWDKTPPGPKLPDEVVDGSSRRYIEAYDRLTGTTFDPETLIKG